MNAPKRPIGRRPGREDTRQALVDAARVLFVEKGYDGASVRAIAGAAGVDAAMVNHWFGGKEGLFQAVMDLPLNPAEHTGELLAGAEVEGLPERIVEVFLSVWEGPDTGPAMIALLRRVLGDPQQVALLRDYVSGSVLAPVAALLATRHPDDAQLRLSLVASHLLGTMTARHILQLEPLAGLPRDRFARVLQATITHLVSDDLDTRVPDAGTPRRSPDASKGARR